MKERRLRWIIIPVICVMLLGVFCWVSSAISRASGIQFVFTARYVFVTEFGIMQSEPLEGISDLPCIKTRRVYVPGFTQANLPVGILLPWTCSGFEVIRDGVQVWPPWQPNSPPSP